MARNPEILKEAQKEVDEAFKSSNGEITDEFLHKLDYVERCVLETCRTHGPVFMMTKICIKEYEFPGQYEESKERLKVEPDIVCVIPVSTIHL